MSLVINGNRPPQKGLNLSIDKSTPSLDQSRQSVPSFIPISSVKGMVRCGVLGVLLSRSGVMGVSQNVSARVAHRSLTEVSVNVPLGTTMLLACFVAIALKYYQYIQSVKMDITLKDSQKETLMDGEHPKIMDLVGVLLKQRYDGDLGSSLAKLKQEERTILDRLKELSNNDQEFDSSFVENGRLVTKKMSLSGYINSINRSKKEHLTPLIQMLHELIKHPHDRFAKADADLEKGSNDISIKDYHQLLACQILQHICLSDDLNLAVKLTDVLNHLLPQYIDFNDIHRHAVLARDGFTFVMDVAFLAVVNSDSNIDDQSDYMRFSWGLTMVFAFVSGLKLLEHFTSFNFIPEKDIGFVQPFLIDDEFLPEFNKNDNQFLWVNQKEILTSKSKKRFWIDQNMSEDYKDESKDETPKDIGSFVRFVSSIKIYKEFNEALSSYDFFIGDNMTDFFQSTRFLDFLGMGLLTFCAVPLAFSGDSDEDQAATALFFFNLYTLFTFLNGSNVLQFAEQKKKTFLDQCIKSDHGYVPNSQANINFSDHELGQLFDKIDSFFEIHNALQADFRSEVVHEYKVLKAARSDSESDDESDSGSD